MATLVSLLLLTLASLLAIPVAVFVAEVVAAIALPRQPDAASIGEAFHPTIAVLVPAHNESIGLLPTLGDAKAQMRAGDRLVVVADNCTDDTACVASAAGADVIVRDDPNKRGKGYALVQGLQHLATNPPGIVIILDADCRLADGAIERLAAVSAAAHRPVQALDLMVAPRESRINLQVAEFAWRVKNWVRPLGLHAVGLPCQLMGTGMAFPWDIIYSADLASGSIVEDLKLGLDLTLAGYPPVFCPSATVISEFPSSPEGVRGQRQRWEQGHVGMILTAAPRLAFVAITRSNLSLLALVLDMAVPPLSLLGMLVIGVSAVAGSAAWSGLSFSAMLISLACLLVYGSGVLLAWLRYGRDILPTRSILRIPSYVIGKVPIYFRVLVCKANSQWIRTDRGRTEH